MPNIIDYAKYYGIRTFEEVPFNDIDALILGKLSYLNFSEVKDSFPNTIEKISIDYFYVMTNQKIKNKKNQKCLKKKFPNNSYCFNWQKLQNILFCN